MYSVVSKVPAELWLRIVQYLVADSCDGTALIHCWLDARRVCRQLLSAVEVVFVDKVLPEAEIEFKVDNRGDYLEGCLERLIYTSNGVLRGCTMHLDRFTSNTCAVFKAHDFRIEVPYNSSFTEVPMEGVKLVEAWMADMRSYLGDDGSRSARFELTPHIIKLCGVVNDTELPDLVLDFEAREISFDWRLMFGKLFSEERFVSKLLEEAPTAVQSAKANSSTGDFSFLDLLEYQRMVWAMSHCYGGTVGIPCQRCAADGQVEFTGTLVKIKGQERPITPKPALPPSNDPALPPHTDADHLRCPTMWRLYRDAFQKLSSVRHDFPLSVAREHQARRLAREQRVQRWYQRQGHTRGVFEDDWVSQARILQRLRLVRLLRREEGHAAQQEYGEQEERLEWYSEPHLLPYQELEDEKGCSDALLRRLLGMEPTEEGCPYGFAYDHSECVIL